MKSMSGRIETTGRFIKALAKLACGQGTQQEQPPEGVSLHLVRLVPASSWTQRAARVSHPAGLLREGHSDRQMRTHGTKGDWKENHPPGLVGEAARKPGAEAWS